MNKNDVGEEVRLGSRGGKCFSLGDARKQCFLALRNMSGGMVYGFITMGGGW